MLTRRSLATRRHQRMTVASPSPIETRCPPRSPPDREHDRNFMQVVVYLDVDFGFTGQVPTIVGNLVTSLPLVSE